MKPIKITTAWTNPITDNVLEITGTVYPKRHATREDPEEEASAEVETITPDEVGFVFTENQWLLIECALIEAATNQQYEQED